MNLDSRGLRQTKKTDVKSFMRDGWLKIGLCFSVITDPYVMTMPVTFGSPDEEVRRHYNGLNLLDPRVGIRVLNDGDIRKRVETESSTNVYATPSSYVYICSPRTRLYNVKKMVCVSNRFS